MDSRGTGHMYPSGAAQDRRSWLELLAYDATNTVVFSSGAVPDGKDPEELADPMVDCTGAGSNACTGFWDRTFKDDNTLAHFFWEVARVDSKLLKPPITLDPLAPGFDHSTTALFATGALTAQIDHITARIRTRALTYAALGQLVASGDLNPMISSQLRTLDASGTLRMWTKATAVPATGCNPF